ncbi:MAG TPA: VOC family protein [Polyangiales bacterium]|nr:VOC family protein [Polyangiales bacterium]
MLDRFDHITIAVNDVDRAVASYALLLGAPATWRGHHPELGTRAALFGLSNAMIEIVGPSGDGPESEGLRAWIAANGEGISALAFGTSDAISCSKTLRERGVRATPPQDGEAHGDDGRTRTYRVVELSTKNTRGLSLLAVERAGANALLAQVAPSLSGVSALDHVVIDTADPDAAIALYRDALGLRLALDREVKGTRMLFFRIGGMTVEVVDHPERGANDAFFGAAYRVRDIDAMHARLQGERFEVSEVRDGAKPGTRVFTVRDRTCGVNTLIIRDPARD